MPDPQPTSTQTTSERFWHWLRKVCERCIKESYMQRTGWDLKCPKCQTWASLAGIRHTSGNAAQERYECLHCREETAWEFHGPVAISVPIQYWPERKHG